MPSSSVLNALPRPRIVQYSHPDFEVTARQVFSFMRAHDQRRYSSATKMALLDAADAKASGATNPRRDLTLYVMEEPYTYDDATEVKSGGMMGAAVVLDGRLMVVAHSRVLRQGVGTRLIDSVMANTYPVSAWVHTTNTTGQHFLLAVGMTPALINNRGAVRYECDPSATQPDEDCPVNGYEDPPTRGLRGRQASWAAPSPEEFAIPTSVRARR